MRISELIGKGALPVKVGPKAVCTECLGARDSKIYLDGIDVTGQCRYADADLGFVVLFRLLPNRIGDRPGQLRFEIRDGQPLLDLKMGKVEIYRPKA